MSKRNKQNKAHQLHDEFVKSNLSDKTIAQDFMRQFLPTELLKNIDLAGLELDNNTYLTAELAKYYSDLVWLCPYRNDSIKIAILLEHKSGPVQYPHLQLLRYMLEMWEKNVRKKEDLLPIVPIIFYHGEGKWNIRSMSEYFTNIGNELNGYIPQFNYELINIGQYTDKEIMDFKVGLLKNVLMALRFSRNKNYLRQNFGFLFIETEEYIETPTGIDFIKTMLVYLLKNTEFSGQEIEAMVNQIPSPVNDIAMSSYDVLIEKGVEKGIKKKEIEVIKSLRLEGSTLEFISKIVKVSVKQVRQILDELGIE